MDGLHLVPLEEHEKAPADPYLGRALAGRYPLVGILGHGGMSKVYLSRMAGGNEFAVKLFLVHPTPQGRDKFLDKAQRLSFIQSSHVVRLHDFGLDPGDTPFMVMEVVRGETFDRVLARGHLGLHRLIDILRQVLLALEAVHANGTVHGDLKPDNIMLTRVGGSERLKLLDFGLEWLLSFGSDPGGETPRTDDLIHGTPYYTSPEQVLGLPLDQRSDIYSLGVVCYEALTGQLPFEGSSPMATMLMHTERPVPQLPPDAPGALRRLVRRMLAKEKETRFQTASAVLLALEEVKDEIVLLEEAIKISHGRRPTRQEMPVSSMGIHLSKLRRELERSIHWCPVPEGMFWQGDDEGGDDQGPLRRVWLDTYRISSVPVSIKLYKRFIEAGGYQRAEFWDEDGWFWRRENEVLTPHGWLEETAGDDLAVTGVSWYEADAFCSWISTVLHGAAGHISLPYEAQWEKAARGGLVLVDGSLNPKPGRRFPWGDDEELLPSWPGEGFEPRVKSPYGCLGMVGGFREWCADWYSHSYYAEAPEQNPQGAEEGTYRVLRACTVREVSPSLFMVSCRGYQHPARRSGEMSFRLAQAMRRSR